MRKRYAEKHEDIERIITVGTETIIEEVNVLMTILSEFTKFARLPEMRPGETDLNKLIENCINLFKGHENIKFELSLDRDIPLIYIDKILFNQVITNLIQNAVDAVNETGKITAKTELINGNTVRISIIDNGTGIKEEYINRIFEPGRSYKPSGTGLGLSIVEMIVLEHSGKVYCNSEYGKGTEFVVEIPVVKNH